MQWEIPVLLLLLYDSLLVKLTTSGPNLSQALDRMHRALREMRIRESRPTSLSWKMSLPPVSLLRVMPPLND